MLMAPRRTPKWAPLTGALLAVTLLAFPGHGSCQNTEGLERFSLAVQGNLIPVYGGDATVGSLTSLGVTGGIYYRMTSSTSVGIAATYAPSDDDPYPPRAGPPLRGRARPDRHAPREVAAAALPDRGRRTHPV